MRSLRGLASLLLAGLVLVAMPARAQTAVTLGGGFTGPQAVALDRQGNVYVADPLASPAQVSMIPRNCRSASCVQPLGGGTFVLPYGVAVDGSGNVYVADQVGFVYEMPPGCTSASCVSTLAPNGPFIGPFGVAVDGSGNVYVTDPGGSAVYELSAGNVAQLGGSRFGFPGGIAVDGSGTIYVADYGHTAVYSMPAGCADSRCVTKLGLGGPFLAPEGVAVDGAGNVFVVDSNNAVVYEMPPDCLSGSCVTTLNLGVAFGFPTGIALDSSGNIYVADNGFGSANGSVDEIVTHPPTIPALGPWALLLSALLLGGAGCVLAERRAPV